MSDQGGIMEDQFSYDEAHINKIVIRTEPNFANDKTKAPVTWPGFAYTHILHMCKFCSRK